MFLLKVFVAFVAVFAAFLNLVYRKLTNSGPIPEFNPNQYWGPGEKPKTSDTPIKEFKIDVPEKELQDLIWRLDHLKPLVPPLEGIQQQYGINSNLLKNVVAFWRTKYNWPERQTFLNQFPQFKTNVQGLDIHFLHVKPKNPANKKVLPLLLVHGWPGSVREFYEILPILTSPSDSRDFVFEVIAPHIPGFGFSQAASKPGLGANQIAVIMNNLMKRLGFQKYYCQGGDFGAVILQSLTVIYPNNVLGYHTNMAIINTPWSYVKYLLGTLYPSWVVKPDHYERVYPLWEKAKERMRETGYLHIQATKPDTIGVGVTDSPAGLAAYILEKFTSGTRIEWQAREDGGLQEIFNYTELLDNVMIYWITGSATTSFRLYSETFNVAHYEQKILAHPLQVPTAIARFSNDFYVADGIIDEIFPNNLQLSDFEGGHFAAMELPEVLAKDLFSAVEKFREFNTKNGREDV